MTEFSDRENMIFFCTSIVETVDSYHNLLHMNIPADAIIEMIETYRKQECHTIKEEEVQQIYFEICKKRERVLEQIIYKLKQTPMKRNDI
jgi:hypothetical protein